MSKFEDTLEKHTGAIKLLGNARVIQGGKGGIVYSVIEIGDQVLQDVSATQSISSFLERGLSTADATTIWLTKIPGRSNRTIFALDLPDGKRYVREYIGPTPVSGAIWSTILIPVFGLGVIMWIHFLLKDLPKYRGYQNFIQEKAGTIVLA